MEIKDIVSVTKKWLMRFIMAFMLGFSNAINEETKTMDDTFHKTEQPVKEKRSD